MIVDRAIYREGKRVGAPDTLAELNAACRNGAGIAWIGVYDPDEEEFATVAREFDLPELAVAHALDVHHRPKLEHYGDTLFLVVGYPLPSTWGRSVMACRPALCSQASTTRAASMS